VWLGIRDGSCWLEDHFAEGARNDTALLNQKPALLRVSFLVQSADVASLSLATLLWFTPSLGIYTVFSFSFGSISISAIVLQKLVLARSGGMEVEPVKAQVQASLGKLDVVCRVRGKALRYRLSLIFSGLDLTSVLPVERSEANAAISIITNITMAVSQIEPANMSSGGSV
jgi:hypothetical protein